MTTTIVMSIKKDDVALATELADEMKSAGLSFGQGPRKRGDPILDIVLTLGSAGVFTAVYQVICKALEKDKDRKILLKYIGGEIEITGHSLPEEMTLLQTIAPELHKQKKSA